MAGLNAHGGTFTFSNFTAAISSISIETPTAEVVDMTSISAAANHVVMVPTGAWSGGAISVDYIRVSQTVDPQTLVSKTARLSFSSAGYSVARQVVLQSASTEARVGDLVRGSLRFVLTDYYPTEE
jgi:hypothetical protein